MNYKLLTVLILSSLTVNFSFATEKVKKNYFSDNNYHHSKAIKKNKKKGLNHKFNELETRKKQGKRPRRIKLKTDTH